MPELLVINDAPEDITLSGEKRTSQVQIAKTGTFKDPRYGVFTIKPSDFDKWIGNFSLLSKSDGRIGLPVDVDHNADYKGNTEAAGWITSLSVKAGRTELWATVEWNDLGVELVGNRRYAYISPSYVANYKDESGKEHGTALLGVALTNRPFLSMATISLSRLHTTEQEPYTPNEMPIPKFLAEALKLPEDSADAVVLARVTELTKEPEPQTKTLAEMAQAEGMFVLTADQYKSLTDNATQGADAAKQLSESRFEHAFSAALNDQEGARVIPAQKDQLKALYDGNADATIALMEALPHAVAAVPIGSGGGGGNGGVNLSAKDIEDYSLDEDTNELYAKVETILAADPKKDYGQAVLEAAGN